MKSALIPHDRRVIFLRTAIVLLAVLSTPLMAAAITFTSGPTATPAAAGTGQSVAFAAKATGGATSPLAYLWKFGDGSQSSNQQNTTHIFSTAGTFSVTCSATDGTTTQSGTVTVTVTAPLLSFGANEGDIYDSDGDGYSDGIELEFGSLYNDPTSTPGGSPLTPDKLGVFAQGKTSLSVALVAGKTVSISISGSIPDNGLRPSAGTKVMLIFGQDDMLFTLDDKLQGSVDGTSLTFKFPKLPKAKSLETRTKKDAIILAIARAKFKSLSKYDQDNLIALLLGSIDADLKRSRKTVPGAIKDMPVAVPVILIIQNMGAYLGTFNLKYSKKPGVLATLK